MYYADNQGHIQTDHYMDDIYSDSRKYKNISTHDDNEIGVGLLREQHTQKKTPNQPGFLYRWFVQPFISLGSWFCSKRDSNEEDTNPLFDSLPQKVNSMNAFNTMIKNKIGLLVLYSTTDTKYFDNFFQDLRKQEYIMEIMVTIHV
jgi:hypothetical protein